MYASAAVPAWPDGDLNWTLLFAREPEPEVEFTEEDLDEPVSPRSSSPKKPKRSSGGRPLFWVLLLILAGGVTYLSMEPDMLTDLLSPILGESTPQQVALPKPRPIVPPRTDPPVASPVPSPSPAIPDPTPPAPAMTPTPTPPGMVQPAMPVPLSPAPLYGEGQRVTVVLELGSPGGLIALSVDAAGTRPGSTIRPGTVLTVLDGELYNNSWVYAVRAEDGSKGWVAEKRLRLKF